MSRKNGWVKLDKMLAQDFKHIKRSFSRIEAMFSYTVDVDNGIEGTMAGYATQWGWSRNKVRRFLNCIRTDEGHLKDRKRTHEGHPIHFIDNDFGDKKDTNCKRTDEGQVSDRYRTGIGHPIRPIHSDLDTKKDRKGTGNGQVVDTCHDTTNKTKTKTKDDILSYITSDNSDFCQNFIKYIQESKGNRAPSGSDLFKNSTNTVDKLIRIDGFDIDYIKHVLWFAVNDDFWSDNVISLAGLRKKTDGLTKFQKIANSFEKSKKKKINGSGRSEQNAKACHDFVYGGENE